MSNSQWRVTGTSGKPYTVTLKDDQYQCGCWPFLKNRTGCKHIDAVKNGDANAVKLKDEPRISYAYVSHVRPSPEQDDVIQVPQIPFGDQHLDFALTVYYDLLQAGVRWKTIKANYRLPIKEADLLAMMQQRGCRTIWDPNSWIDGRGYTRYKRVPLDG